MHDIEHKSAQEEPASTSEQKGMATTGRQKLPRAWRYTVPMCHHSYRLWSLGLIKAPLSARRFLVRIQNRATSIGR